MRWALKPITRVFTRDRRGDDRDTGEEGHVTIETETRVGQPPSKERLELSDARGSEEGCPLTASRVNLNLLTLTLNFRPPARIDFCYFKPWTLS